MRQASNLARRAANAGSLLFFVASKIFWIFFSPVAVLLIAAFVGVLWSKGRFVGMGRAIAVVSMLALIVAAMTPLGLILVSPLEDRFPEPLADLPPPRRNHWCLGGAINGPVSKMRGQAVGEGIERLVEAAILAKRYPEARILFSGGSGSLFEANRPRRQKRGSF